MKKNGERAAPEEEGELWVEGPTVMLGYWGSEPQRGPYRTGDLVRRIDQDNFEFVGRLDHMLKIRGYRVEPAEIESILASHPAVTSVAVCYDSDRRKLIAALQTVRGEKPSLLALKLHCAASLPPYMIVDQVVVFEELPRTPNGKVDRTAILERARGSTNREP